MFKVLSAVVVLLTVALGLAPTHVDAQATEQQKAVARLLTVMGVPKMMDEMIPAVVQQVATDARRRKPDLPDEAVAIISEEIVNGFKAERKSFLRGMANAYMKHFTAEEMYAIADFYKTPAGQKSLNALPQLTVEGMQLGQSMVAKTLPGIMKRAEARLEAIGYSLK